MVPGNIAAWIDRAARLENLARSVHGNHKELDAVLEALLFAAREWRRSEVGTEPTPPREPAALLPWLTSTEAAIQLGMTKRGVIKALAGGRLDGQLTDGRWRVSREGLAHFRASR
jgi:hypothetical protein